MLGVRLAAGTGKDDAIDRGRLGQFDRQVGAGCDEPRPRLAIDGELRSVGSGKVFDLSSPCPTPSPPLAGQGNVSRVLVRRPDFELIDPETRSPTFGLLSCASQTSRTNFAVTGSKRSSVPVRSTGGASPQRLRTRPVSLAHVSECRRSTSWLAPFPAAAFRSFSGSSFAARSVRASGLSPAAPSHAERRKTSHTVRNSPAA